MPAGPSAGARHPDVEAEEPYRRDITTITHGYVEMFRRPGRHQETAALETRAR